MLRYFPRTVDDVPLRQTALGQVRLAFVLRGQRDYLACYPPTS